MTVAHVCWRSCLTGKKSKWQHRLGSGSNQGRVGFGRGDVRRGSTCTATGGHGGGGRTPKRDRHAWGLIGRSRVLYICRQQEMLQWRSWGLWCRTRSSSVLALPCWGTRRRKTCKWPCDRPRAWSPMWALQNSDIVDAWQIIMKSPFGIGMCFGIFSKHQTTWRFDTPTMF